MNRTSFGLRQWLRRGDMGSELFRLVSGAAYPLAASPSSSQSPPANDAVHLMWGASTVWIYECLANRLDASPQQQLI